MEHKHYLVVGHESDSALRNHRCKSNAVEFVNLELGPGRPIVGKTGLGASEKVF